MIQVSANKAFYFLFIVSGLLILLLLSLLTKIGPLTIEHALYSCKQAITGFSIWLPHSSPPLFIVILLFIFLTGLSFLIYQINKTRKFVNNLLLTKVKTPQRVNEIAKEVGILGKVVVIETNSLTSFCYGLTLPRICLSLNIVKKLTDNELKAVLLHEKYHLQNRDPLKVLLSQVAISMFFFVPILRDFHKHYSYSKEIHADQVVSHTKYAKDLKSALLKTLTSSSPNLSGVAFFSGEGILEERVKALTSPNFKLRIQLSLSKILISFLVFAFSFLLLDLQVHAMENGDGSHSYFILSPEDDHLLFCDRENDTKDLPLGIPNLFSPADH
jgi:beta-lactamase regulating signal transducer with metallopeptidase domain